MADPRPSTSEAGRSPSREELTPTAEQRDARLGWWREARFGMFVHWGVYAGLGGTWEGKTYGGYAEHIQRALKIPIPIYREKVAGTFNPIEFNADEWMNLARQTGMGYFIITAKHHDGFAMYDSTISDYNIVRATPFGRDPMKELRAAAKKYGVKFGFYYSHAFDWGEKDGPGNDWDYHNPGGDKLLHGSNWWEKDKEFIPRAQKYVDEKSIPQILELINNYEPDILWFDTPHKLPPEENLRILAAVRRAAPNVVVNGRLVRGCGDYANTADKPAEFFPTPGDWEAIPTTNESYGYNQNDHSHKPPSHFIQLLAKAAARGGNVLLNVGPMGNGKIDPKDVAIFQGIGQWWKRNGESIRGTTRTPLAVQSWGESTRKGNTIYLHVFDWPADGQLLVSGLLTDVTQANLLADPSQTLTTRRDGKDIFINIPKTAPDPADSVIVLQCAGEAVVDPARLISSSDDNHLRALDSSITGGLAYGAGKTRDAYVHQWTNPKASVSWPARLRDNAQFEITVIYDAPEDSKLPATVQGDANAERIKPHKGAGGRFRLEVGDQTFEAPVRQGSKIAQTFSPVTLKPGSFDIRLSAEEITGEELMRVRTLMLKPRNEKP